MYHRIRIVTGLGMILASLALSGSAHAQPQPDSPLAPPPPGKVEPALFSSLRDVINQGATLFNEKGDYAGCYRVFQGALIAVRPYLVTDNPDLLKHVDKSLQSAEKLPRMVDRAFALRAVLDSVRDFYRPKTGSPTGPSKRPIETLPDPKKKVENKEESKSEPIPKDVKKKDPAKDDGKKEEKKEADPLKVESRFSPRNVEVGDGEAVLHARNPQGSEYLTLGLDCG